MISATRGSLSVPRPAPARRPSLAVAAADKTTGPWPSFPQDRGGSGLDAIADYISSTTSTDQLLIPALSSLGEWSFSSDPTAFLRKFQRVMYSHPIVSHVPTLRLAIAQCYLQLGDVASCLCHLLEAHQRIVKLNHGRESTFVQAKISEIAFALAVTARIQQKDPVKCLTYLNLVSETKYRIAVTLQTAHCLLMMNEVEAALPLFLDLAERTGDPDIVLVCARIYATLHQLPAMCAILKHLRSLKPTHPGILDLDAILHEQVDQYQIEATKLSYLRQYNDVLEVLELGLELVPTHAELLMLKAETLFALGNPNHLLEFLATWPPTVPTTAKVTRFKVAALEKLLHHHWSSARYQSALTILDRLRAARTEPLARDRLWHCQLRFLAYGFNASSVFTSVGTNLTPDSGMRLLEQDLVQYLDDCARASDGGGSVDEMGTAEALLCQVYARRARNLLAKGSTKGQGPDQWRAGLKLLDKAIETSFPRLPGLGDPDWPPFPRLLSMFPKPIQPDKYPPWAQVLPASCQAAALWLEKSRVLEKLAERERAVAAARAALVLVPGNLEAKQWLLQLTGDQDELAQLAAVQVAQSWARDMGSEGDLASASLNDEATNDVVTATEGIKRLSPPQSAATVESAGPATLAAAATATKLKEASSTKSAADNAQSTRRPTQSRLFPQANPTSTSPPTPPSSKQPQANRQKAKPGSIPSPAPTSLPTISDQTRRPHPTTRDSTALPSVLVGTRVSVTSATPDHVPAPTQHPAPRRHASKHRSALAPSVAVKAADMPAQEHAPSRSVGAGQALGPPAALAHSISKHYQVLLGQYGGVADGAANDASVLFGSGATDGAATGSASGSHDEVDLDIQALASDGRKAAAYVTRAVEEKVKRDMVQAHQMAEALVQQKLAQTQDPRALKVETGARKGGGEREASEDRR